MKYTVNNLGSVGWISPLDRRGWEIPPEAWTGGRNMRTRDGAMEGIGGFTNAADPGAKVWWADYVDTISSIFWVMFGYTDENKIRSYDGLTYRDITGPADNTDEDNDLWITSKLNGILLATNWADAPRCLYDPVGGVDVSTVFVTFPDWPAAWRCKFLIAHKNFIVTMYHTDGTEVYPNKVVWSGAALPNRMPGDGDGDGVGDGTGWAVTDAASLAGELTLGEGTGPIVGAELLRDDIIVYTERATFRMYYTENAQQPYRVERIFRNRGLFNPRCVVEAGNRHFVVTDDAVVVHDGQTYEEVAEGRVHDYLLRYFDLDARLRAFVYADRERSEFSVAYCTEDPANQDNPKQYPNERLIYNWDTKTWSTPSDLPYASFVRGLPQIDYTIADLVIWDQVDPPITPDDSWDTGPDIPAALGADTLSERFGLYGGGGWLEIEFFQYEIGTAYRWLGNSSPGFAGQYELVRHNIDLTGDDNTAMVQAVYPRLEIGGTADPIEPTQIYMAGVFSLEQDPRGWQFVDFFDPRIEHRVTDTIRGRRHDIEFRANQHTTFRMAGYDIRFVDCGEY